MATIFMDSFSHYATGVGAAQKWSAAGVGPTISSGGNPWGGNYGTGTFSRVVALSSGTGFTIGLHVKQVAASGAFAWLQISNAGAATVTAMGFTGTDTYGMGSDVTPGTGVITGGVVSGNWDYVEFSASTLANGATGIIRVNGVQVATGSINVVTAASPPYWLTIGTSSVIRVADLYVRDAGNTFLVPVGATSLEVHPILPTGVGASSQWTPNGDAINWQCVSHNPPVPGTDFVSDSTSGHKDLYALGSLPAGTSSVLSVQGLAYASNASTGAIKLDLSNGVTTNVGSSQATSTTAAYLLRNDDTNPITSAAWTTGDFTTLQAGQQVT